MKTNRKNQKTLSSGEEKILAARIQAGRDDDGSLTTDAKAARDELVTQNIGLVYSQSNKWRTIAPRLAEDLEQVGLETLVQCVDSFDPAKGTRFSTHAYAQIGWALGRYADSQRSSIRKPVSESAAYRKGKKEGVSTENLVREFPHQAPVISLDALKPGTALHPIFSVPEANTAAEDRVDSVMENSGLTPRQKKVIELVFGLTVHPRFTQHEAAALLGVDPSTISKIVKRALAKMKVSQMAVAA